MLWGWGKLRTCRRWSPMAPSLSAGQPNCLRRGGSHHQPLPQNSLQCHWGQGPPYADLSGALRLLVDSEYLYRTSWPWGPGTKLLPTAQSPSNILLKTQLSNPLPFPDLPASACSSSAHHYKPRSSHQIPVCPRPDFYLKPSHSPTTFNSTQQLYYPT